MEARVLTKGEIQQTLSAAAANAKKKKRKGVRNILALPFEQFWPEVSESDSAEIKTLLKELLPEARIVYNKPAWKDVHSMSKEQRKTLRQELKKKSPVPEYRKYLLPGHRNVSRAVEQNRACCCILSSDVRPRFMMTGIVTACLHNNIPCIALSALQEVTRSALSFSATALALKKCVSESANSKFYPVFKVVSELSKKLSLALLEQNTSKANEELNLGNQQQNKMDTLQTEESAKYLNGGNGNESKNEINTKPYKYLYLNANGRRAFVPEREKTGRQCQTAIDEQLASLDFISLSTDRNRKPNRKRRFQKPEQELIGTDDEAEDEVMQIDDMFVIDVKPSNKVPAVEEKDRIPVEPKMKKPKKQKKLKPSVNTRYFPVNIKTVTNNPAKASKPKKKKKVT